MDEWKPLAAGASVADRESVSEFVIVTLNGKRVVGRCRLTQVENRVESTWYNFLKV